LALTDDVRKNAVRQKIKGIRDSMLSVYVEDVMGRSWQECSAPVQPVKAIQNRHSFIDGPAAEDSRSPLAWDAQYCRSC